jgi:hypothetical protein
MTYAGEKLVLDQAGFKGVLLYIERNCIPPEHRARVGSGSRTSYARFKAFVSLA